MLTGQRGIAQELPREWYRLSPDGLTLELWKGDTAVVNMAADPFLRRVEYIAPFAFIKLDSLGQAIPDYQIRKLYFSPKIKEIGRQAFWSVNLKEIYFTEGLQTLGYRSFIEPALQELYLPASLREYDQSFYKANQLREIKVAEGSRTFSVREHCLISERDSKLLLYPGGILTLEPLLPQKIVSIGASAFAFHPYIRTILGPEGVTDIEEEAFYAANELTHLKLPSTLQSVGARTWLFSGLDTVSFAGAFPPKYKSGDLLPKGSPIAMIVVPDGARSIYGEDRQLSLMAREIITESEYKSLLEISEEKANEIFTLVDRELTLHLNDTNEEAMLFDKDGHLVAHYRQSGSYLLMPGMYLLQIGRKSYKLVVRGYDITL